MKDDIDVNNIRELFKDKGCISEKVNNAYFVMEILAGINYQPIKKDWTNWKTWKLLSILNLVFQIYIETRYK